MDGDYLLSTISQKTSIQPADVLLLAASRENNVPEVNILIKQRNANVDATDNIGRSPICWAAINNNFESFEALIKLGADTNRPDKYGMTPLLWSSWSGSTKMMIKLIKVNPDCVTQMNKQGMNILHCAVSNNQSQVVDFIGECLLGFQFQSKDQRGMTALHLSCIEGFDETIDSLLTFSGIHVNVKDDFGCTALHYASKNGNLRCVNKLIGKGADMEIQDNFGQTCLHYAAHDNQCNAVKILMKNLTADGMNCLTNKRQSALMLAAGRGNIKVVEILIRHPQVDVDVQDENGNTACHLSSRKMKGNVEVTKLLIRRSHVNLKNNVHQIPLHVSVDYSQTSIVDLLIRAGSDLKNRNKSGRSPLDLAVRSNDVSIVDLLIEAERINFLSDDDNYFKNKNIAWREMNDIPCFDEEVHAEGEGSHDNSRVSVEFNSFDVVHELDQIITPLETIDEESESGDVVDDVTGISSEGFKTSNSSENLGENILVQKIFWKISHNDMKHDDWKKLAKHWKFQRNHIEAIERQYSTSHKHRNHGNRLLMIWYHCFKELHPRDNPTKELYEAFVAIRNKAIAEKVRKNLNNDSKKKCLLS